MTPRVAVITPPEPVVTLDEAFLHLRVDSDDEDTLIEAMIAAATAHIDGPAGWLQRSIGEQELEAYFQSLDQAGGQRLPCGPIIEVHEIATRLADGSWLPIDAGSYELRGDRIGLAWQRQWPATMNADENFRVRYRAGYLSLPAPIRAAILLMVGDLHRNRSSSANGIVSAVPMSTTVETLLAPYRVWL